MKKILKTIIAISIAALLFTLCVSVYNTHKMRNNADMAFEESNGHTVYVSFGEVEYV